MTTRRFKTISRLEIDTIGVSSSRDAKSQAIRTLKSRVREYGLDYLIQILDLKTTEVSPSAVDQPPTTRFRRIKR